MYVIHFGIYLYTYTHTYIYIYIYIYTFFRILQENKSLRKSYEDYFIDRSKPLLNKKT